MATNNRRVAAYLPKLLDERLSAFKRESGIEGDSAAIIHILSNYLGVAHDVTQLVAHRSNEEVMDRLKLLEEKFQKLAERVDAIGQTKADAKDELLSELKGGLASGSHPDQLSFLAMPSNGFDLQKKSLEPMTGYELARRFNLSKGSVNNYRGDTAKGDPEKFARWSQTKDPEGISWQYDPATKLYRPISQ